MEKQPLSKTQINLITIGSALVVFVLFVAITNFSETKYFLGSLMNWGTGNISTEDYSHYAYGENIGWINFNPTGGGVQLKDNELVGYAWGENTGWISLNCSNTDSCADNSGVDYKVENDGEGNLSGYAYGENIGWINFNPTVGSTSYGVKVSGDGTFSGYAWGENTGWISFNCADTNSCADNSGVDYKVVSAGQYYNQVATTVTIQTQPVGSGCYQMPLTTQPAVLVQDQHGVNMPDGTVVSAALAGGTGILSGTKTASTVSGVAIFTNLGYSIASQTFSIAFTAGDYSTNSNTVGPLSANCGSGGSYSASVISEEAAITEIEPTSEPASAPPETTTLEPTAPPASTLIPAEIPNYIQEKLNIVKENIPDATNVAPENKLSVVSILQKMLAVLKSLIESIK